MGNPDHPIDEERAAEAGDLTLFLFVGTDWVTSSGHSPNRLPSVLPNLHVADGSGDFRNAAAPTSHRQELLELRVGPFLRS